MSNHRLIYRAVSVSRLATAFLVLQIFTIQHLQAQEFCGKTLQEWLQSGVNVIDRRGTSPCGQSIQGSNQPDLILGTECADVIDGNRRDDCIYGFGGADDLRGGPGDDEIWGGNGDDVLVGDAQRDRLFGELGNDRLIGDSGRDQLFGGPGRDQLVGRSSRDQLCGQGDDDRLDGRSARDNLDGGAGQDQCDGGGQRDRCDLCESETSCERNDAADCPDDPNFLAGTADPGCTVCAQSLADGALYCALADDNGSFGITAGDVSPSTTQGPLPNGSFRVFCIACEGDGVSAVAGSGSVDVTCTPCTGREVIAGRCDFFQGCSAGDTVESAVPRPALFQYLFNNTLTAPPLRPPLDFDDLPGVGGIPTDSHFAHTFTGLPTNVCAATLSATLMATTNLSGNSANNDRLNLDLSQATNSFAWSGGLAALTGTQWPRGAVGTVNLDLRNLPGGTDLLSNPNAFADGNLDIYIQDDTGVDCLRLCYHTRCADLAIIKELTGGSLNGNVRWEFTLTVSNVGSMATQGSFEVSDVLPSGLAFVSGGGDGWTCTADGQQVSCMHEATPPIPAGGMSTLTLVVEATERSAFRDLENCATVAVAEDTNPSNDKACVNLPCPHTSDPRVHPLTDANDPAVCAAAGPEVCEPGQTWYWGTCGCGCFDPIDPDLTLQKSFIGDPGANTGKVSVTVGNPGEAATAGDVTVIDPLPEGSSFVPSGDYGNGWTCRDEAQQVVCRHQGPLDPGGLLPLLTIPVRFASVPGAGTSNCAVVKTFGDEHPENNTSCTTFETCPDPADPGIGYVSRDPEQCAIIRFFCPSWQAPFSGACGCGCRGTGGGGGKWRFWGARQTGSDAALSSADSSGLVTGVDLDDASGLGTSFEYRWRERFGIEVAAIALRTDVRTELQEVDGGGPFFRARDTGTTGLITLGANFHLRLRSRADLYIGPFLGLVDLPDPPNLRAEASLAAGLVLGVDLALGDSRWGLSTSLRYLEADVDLSAEETQLEFELEPLIFGLGICYSF